MTENGIRELRIAKWRDRFFAWLIDFVVIWIGIFIVAWRSFLDERDGF